MRSDVLARHMKQHSMRNESSPVTNIYVTNNYNTTSGVSTERKDEENENEETQYFYFCLDCEKQHCDCGSSSFNNPRFPLSINISKHIEETNHMNFVPIDDKANVKMSNISFSPHYNKVVRKKWRRMVLDGDIKEVQYSTPRKCKKCSLSFVDAIDMFKHIKDIHIHNQSSTVEATQFSAKMGRHKKVMLKVCYREMRSDVLARHMTNNYNTTSTAYPGFNIVQDLRDL